MASRQNKASTVCCHVNQTHGGPRHANRKKESQRSVQVEPEERGGVDKLHAHSETGDRDEYPKRSCKRLQELCVEVR